jgi:hypothetical protein
MLGNFYPEDAILHANFRRAMSVFRFMWAFGRVCPPHPLIDKIPLPSRRHNCEPRTKGRDEAVSNALCFGQIEAITPAQWPAYSSKLRRFDFIAAEYGVAAESSN